MLRFDRGRASEGKRGAATASGGWYGGGGGAHPGFNKQWEIRVLGFRYQRVKLL